MRFYQVSPMLRRYYWTMVIAVGLTAPAQAAEPIVSYSAGFGHTNNVFANPTPSDGSFHSHSAGLRGTLELEAGNLKYDLSYSNEVYAKISAANQQSVKASVSLTRTLATGADWGLTLETGALDSGSTLDVGDISVDYRKRDVNFKFSSELGYLGLGGKNQLALEFENSKAGKARFQPNTFEPTQLEASEAILKARASHIRGLGGGEVGFNSSVQKSLIPSEEQLLFERFSATSLRGSIAYARKLSETFAIIAEIGLITIEGHEVPETFEALRPYMRVKAETALTDDVSAAISYEQDYRLTSIDDAVGEFQRSIAVEVGSQLSEKMRLTLAFERLLSEWVYFDYRHRQSSLSAQLSWMILPERTVTVEVARVMRQEDDVTANYSQTTISSKLSGSF